MTAKKIPNVALVGIGGYGKVHYNAYLKLMDEGRMRFTGAVVLPHLMEAYAEQVAELNARGIPIYPSDDALLAAQGGALDLVGLPVGIAAHRPLTCKFLERGVNVLLEKPVAGCLRDVDDIIEVRDRSKRFVAIGYHNMYGRELHRMKREILSGEYGRLLEIRTVGVWPRNDAYYARNNWAGKELVNGIPVFDSPLNNAFAHYLNMPLFVAGTGFDVTAHAVEMQAELVRARQSIETFDTCALRLRTDNVVRILILQSHTCAASLDPVMTFQLERGRYEWSLGGNYLRCFSQSGALVYEEPLPDYRDSQFRDVVDRVNDPGVFIYTPENGREQTFCIQKMHERFPIHALRPDEYQVLPDRDNLHVIPDLLDVFDRCFRESKLPSEVGATWSMPAMNMSLA